MEKNLTKKKTRQNNAMNTDLTIYDGGIIMDVVSNSYFNRRRV